MASILSRRFRLPGLMWDLDNTPLGVQHPHDEVAVCPRAVDEAGHVAGDAGVGDDRPQRPQPERFLNVDDEKNTSHDDKHPAGTELQATGEKARKRSDDTRTDLTPQEEEIAQLAREGQTNSEIGAQLFIGGRTVEWHLGNVFAKLDISSRLELEQALRRRGVRS
jgi:DNA-binding CsgD family transcriptional regulator